MNNRKPVLLATDLQVSFQSQGNVHQVLSIDHLQAETGEHIVITGPSGAGKTTLLYVLTGIEQPDRGRVVWSGQDISAMAEFARDKWRRYNVGFIFQDFYLFPGMSVLQNVLLPATFGKVQKDSDRAFMLLERVGISTTRQTIDTLSRGERQRVAIARALLLSPKIIVADEPTASLDRETGKAVIELLISVGREEEVLLCCVSHDAELIRRLDTVYRLENSVLNRVSSPEKTA